MKTTLADSDGSRKKSKTKMEIWASERGKVPYLKVGRVGDNKDELNKYWVVAEREGFDMGMGSDPYLKDYMKKMYVDDKNDELLNGTWMAMEKRKKRDRTKFPSQLDGRNGESPVMDYEYSKYVDGKSTHYAKAKSFWHSLNRVSSNSPSFSRIILGIEGVSG